MDADEKDLLDLLKKNLSIDLEIIGSKVTVRIYFGNELIARSWDNLPRDDA